MSTRKYQNLSDAVAQACLDDAKALAAQYLAYRGLRGWKARVEGPDLVVRDQAGDETYRGLASLDMGDHVPGPVPLAHGNQPAYEAFKAAINTHVLAQGGRQAAGRGVPVARLADGVSVRKDGKDLLALRAKTSGVGAELAAPPLDSAFFVDAVSKALKAPGWSAANVADLLCAAWTFQGGTLGDLEGPGDLFD